MQIIYRISDESYPKPRMPGATKEICLMNFVKAFVEVIFPNGDSPPENPPMSIIADNCSRKTIRMVMDTGIPTTVTYKGNSGSLLAAIKMALTFFDEEELVYFCEDDYLHHPKSPKLLEEIQNRADYFTLYDHPDKYTPKYCNGETSQVIRTASSHWRFTQSTCMTFGCKVKTLREDWDKWEERCQGPHPEDHQLFTELGEQGRKLAVCIPGAACHTDLMPSGENNQVLLDDWAIQMMINHLKRDILVHEEARPLMMEMTRGKEPWHQLVALDALKMNLIK